jgi:hypothetical protein
VQLRVSVDEGHALEVLDLLCRGVAVRIVPSEPVSQPRPELTELAARRIASACLRALSESGRREQVVLREGRRVRGRIWDAARTAGFRLRFTAASHELWVQTTQRLAEIARVSEVEGEGSHRVRRQIRRIVKIAGTDTGDWLLYALARRNLARAAIPPEIREELGRRLCLGSPLASLCALEDAGDETGPWLDRLLEGPAVVLVECLEDLLAAQWSDEIAACMRAGGGERRTERLSGAAATLECWLDRLDQRGRLDLARPLCLAFARLLASAWDGTPEEVAQRLLSGAGLILRAQRDALLRALARVVQLGQRLHALRETLARERFGDPRYEEAQLWLETHDTLLRPLHRRLDALVNLLTGRLG